MVRTEATLSGRTRNRDGVDDGVTGFVVDDIDSFTEVVGRVDTIDPRGMPAGDRDPVQHRRHGGRLPGRLHLRGRLIRAAEPTWTVGTDR